MKNVPAGSSNQTLAPKGTGIDDSISLEFHESVSDPLLQALQVSEARWRTLVENTQDWVWEVDANGRYTYSSPQVRAMLGYEPEEVLGKLPFDFMPPEERNRILEAFNSAVSQYAPFQGLENINRRKDGSLVVLETNGVPFFDGSGNLAGYRGIDRDVTERKRIETALRRKSEELEAMFSNTHVLIAVLDSEFNFIRVNRAYAVMACIAEESLMGCNHFELFPHEENEHLFKQVVMSGEPYSITAKPFEFPDQPELGITYWDWTLTPIKDEKGFVEGVVLTLIDATERERARLAAEAAHWQAQKHLERRVAERTAALEAANRELEAFSYAVSHDLRAPLRAIKGFSRTLQEDFSEVLNNVGREYLERIQLATAHMGELIDGLLRLSLVSRAELMAQRVNLTEIAHDIISQLREEHPDRLLDIRIDENMTAVGDPALLRQLLHNMLGNAWKFTAHTPMSHIHFGKDSPQGRDVFVVRDNGVGFDNRYADKLFQPFTRLHGKGEFEGTGIGLATYAALSNFIKAMCGLKVIRNKGQRSISLLIHRFRIVACVTHDRLLT